MASGPASRITEDDVLDVFRGRADPTEPLTAPEIADQLGCSRRTALDRLHDLAERGVLRSKKVGARSRVWWSAGDVGTDGVADSIESDPFLSMTPEASGKAGVSEAVDEHLAEAIAGESDDE